MKDVELGRVRSAIDFLVDAVDFLRSLPKDALARLPVLSALAEVAPESLPAGKLALRVAELLKPDAEPARLGEMACSLAYLQSIEQVFESAGYKRKNKTFKELFGQQVAEASGAVALDLANFSFETALEDPFVESLGGFFSGYLAAVGYTEEDRRVFLYSVHLRFVSNLRQLCVRQRWRDRFQPFLDAILTRSDDERVRADLARHAEFQRAQFEELPVLGQPFALRHIYVDTQCGVSTWGEIHPDSGDPVDPFSESCGGREDLLRAVERLMGSPSLDEPILVQGVAGSGKSSFTMRLASELVRRGLRPLRVRLTNLRLDRHAENVLLEALEVEGSAAGRTKRFLWPPDGFSLSRDFLIRETVDLGEAEISPYVLILDGWDEISISTEEGFRTRVARLLSQVWGAYLGKGAPFVRIILTGRPTRDVLESGELRKGTPVLTVRPLAPSHLRQLIETMGSAVEESPVPVEGWEEWSLDTARFQDLCVQYEDSCRGGEPVSGGPRERSGSLDVLGSPLLAFLAVRVLSQLQADPVAAVRSRTQLLRRLVDLTCRNAAKAGDEDDTARQERVTGAELRNLLHETAKAMTCLGVESISYRELSHRLHLQGDELRSTVGRATSERKLSRLLISYFFQSSTENLGCEFAHKSFREYLFAEGVVELLKSWAVHDPSESPPRVAYWADFEPVDARRGMSRDLCGWLVAQWPSPEAASHLLELLAWEIGRSAGTAEAESAGLHVPTIPLEGWVRVSDHLGELWTWWAEGVHLRPQPKQVRGHIDYDPPLTMDSIVQVVGIDDLSPAPMRTTSADAHLGDALLLICAQVRDQLRRHNEAIPRFGPGGSSPFYFRNYCARLNADGWRPLGPFAAGAFLRGTDLRGVDLKRADLKGADLGGADLSGADLGEADLRGASVGQADLTRAGLTGARLAGADLRGAALEGAFLDGANLKGADLAGANLTAARLERADLREANLSGAVLNAAELSRAQLAKADLSRADLRDANVRGAELRGALMCASDLRGAAFRSAILRSADLRGAVLCRADLRAADLRRADLRGADLTGADMSAADLREVRVDGETEGMVESFPVESPRPDET